MASLYRPPETDGVESKENFALFCTNDNATRPSVRIPNPSARLALKGSAQQFSATISHHIDVVVVRSAFHNNSAGAGGQQTTTLRTVGENTILNEVKSVLFTLVAAAFVTACTEQPEREVSAVVLSIAPQANPRWNPDEVVVTARSPDGAFGSKSILISRLNCKVGDTLQATARGIAVSLNDKACER